MAYDLPGETTIEVSSHAFNEQELWDEIRDEGITDFVKFYGHKNH